MPNSIKIRQCLRKEPTTREDQMLLKLKELGLLPCKEEKVLQVPKAPGVFSLGPDRVAMQVPNDEVVQPTVDVRKLDSFQDSMKDLFGDKEHHHGHGHFGHHGRKRHHR